VSAAESCIDWAGIRHQPVPASAPPPRIACLVPSLTELLFSLELGDAVVARTGFCVHPRGEVRRVPKVGGTKDVDLVRLRALAPTHLVVNVDENRKGIVDAAREFVAHVIVTHPVVVEDNIRLYALFGGIFGRQETAAAMTRRFVAALAELDAACGASRREQVLYLIWRNPWMTVAGDTYIASMLRRAGWDAVAPASAARYPQLADDDPVWRLADRILLSSEPYAFRERDARTLTVSSGKPVQLIDGEMTSWYGPRAIAGLRYLAQLRAIPPAAPGSPGLQDEGSPAGDPGGC
jgi:ABC-type Fe3+-hydroxamate transport system substrate-binding protein